MSEEIREIYKEELPVDEEFEEVSEDEGLPEFQEEPEFEGNLQDEEDLEFERRMQRRRARVRGRKRRRKILGVVLIIAVFATLATMCGKDIVKLKAENIALQKEQKELEEERDRLREEVKNSGDREYVQEQARKQLKLLNPGELLFTFEEEEE